MMEIKCVDAERIGNVLEYPADHPVRRHLAECPRCRSLAQSYHAFLAAAPTDGAEVSTARPWLDAAIARGAAAAFPAGSRATLPMKSSWLRAWLRPLPALATAVVVIAAAMLLWPRGDQTSQLRVGGVSADTWHLTVSAARSDGSVELSWDAITGADAYEVHIYGPELEELLQLPAAEPSLTIHRSALETSLSAGSELTWSVRALRGGDVMGTSPPGSFRLP